MWRTAPTRPAARRCAAASPRPGAPPARAAAASSSSRPRRYHTPGDIAAAETAGPLDAVDDGVGLVARRRHVLVPGDDGEHAAALADEPALAALGAGKEDLDPGGHARRPPAAAGVR